MALKIKTGGRKKGSVNKVTADLREKIKMFIECNFDDIQTTYNQLEAKDKVNFIEKLFKYVCPTLSSTDFKTDFNQLSDDQLDAIINKLKSNNNE